MLEFSTKDWNDEEVIEDYETVGSVAAYLGKKLWRVKEKLCFNHRTLTYPIR